MTDTRGGMTSGFWRERNVLVTGASGLLGSWLTQRLVADHANVTILLRDAVPLSHLVHSGTVNAVTVVRAELEDYASIERTLNEYEIDTVLHLGAQTIVGTAHRSPLSTFEANIRGTYHLLEACRVHSRRVRGIVVASSDKAYGEQAKLPYVEEMPLLGRHPYAVSKACTDLLAQSYMHTYNLPAAIVRCGNIFGGGDLHWNRIVPGTIRSLLLGERPQIRSNGKMLRDYVYVQDVVSAYLCVAEKLQEPKVRGSAFNIASEKPSTVLDIVGRIQQLMGCSHLRPEIHDCAEGEIRKQYLSARRARRILKWRPRYSLEAALSETIAWYREFFEGKH